MNGGIINCDCGQTQYVETINENIACIKCKKIHSVFPIPEPIIEPIIEPIPEPEPEIGEDDGTII